MAVLVYKHFCTCNHHFGFLFANWVNNAAVLVNTTFPRTGTNAAQLNGTGALEQSLSGVNIFQTYAVSDICSFILCKANL
jgi:hypothetical protein